MAQISKFTFAYKCKQCRNSFSRVKRGQRFCSIECQKQNHRDKINVYRERVKRKQSRDIDSTKHGLIKRVCHYCQKVFYTYASQVRLRGGLFCSHKCALRSRLFVNLSISSLDNLFRKAVKIKAHNRCEYCGAKSKLTAHHIFSRTNHSVRWYMDNGICLCSDHHTQGNFSAHKSPTEFVEWLRINRSDEWYNSLRRKAKMGDVKIDKNLVAQTLLSFLDESS